MENPTVAIVDTLPGESSLQWAAISGGVLAESWLALLQYKREQPQKVIRKESTLVAESKAGDKGIA
jgi:hypothetical protein